MTIPALALIVIGLIIGLAIGLIIGLIVGGPVGFYAAVLMTTAGSADRHGEFLREMRLREEKEGEEKQP